MPITPYLSFDGRCEEAFNAYTQIFGGTVGSLFRYAGSPMADLAPPGWEDKIMHGSVTVGGLQLSGADVLPAHYEAPKGFSLSIQITGAEEAERIFDQLARNGTITMPLEKTFWAVRFGMVTDRFGIPWMINCEGDS